MKPHQIFLFFALLGLASTVYAQIPSINLPTTQAFLRGFFSLTGGPFWKNNAGWINDDPNYCTFYGISCFCSPNGDSTACYQIVTHIQLGFNNLTGILPTSFAAIPNLAVLNLTNNAIEGPVNLTACPNLQSLTLSYNRLKGELRGLVGLNSLRSLVLNDNFLVGPIPEEFGNMVNLAQILVSNNSLSGSFPSSINQLRSVQKADFHLNLLSGSVNLNGWGNRTQSLNLANNLFTGDLSGLSNLTSLLELDVSLNLFKGNLDPLLSLASLRSLKAGHNYFSGLIPLGLSQMVNLSLLDLQVNLFRGEIPIEVVNMPRLVYLHVGLNSLVGSIPSLNNSRVYYFAAMYNKLEGTIPDGFWSRNLIYAFIYGNLIGGPITPAIGNAISLDVLVGFSNLFNGSIPTEIGNCTSMTIFYMSFNRFTGSIPDGLANLPKLNTLLLQGNKISGSIPDSIGKMKSLVSLNLRSNDLSGEVPLSIKNCTILTVLDLGHNNLKGPVLDTLLTSTSLVSLDLSYNSFEATVPQDISRLFKLKIFIIRSNLFYGEWPQDADNFLYLDTLDISYNRFTSYSYGSMAKTKTLKYLDVSHNLMKGRFSFMTGPDQKVAMPNLEYLDESYNFFGLSVHFEVSDFSKLKYLDLSHNNISGIVLPFRAAPMIELLDISHNRFTGVSGEPGGDPPLKLKYFDISSNEFTGTMSPGIGLLYFLEHYNCSNNFLEGKVPSSYFNLLNMKSLDFSNNLLTGPIPDFIGGLPKLSSFIIRNNDFFGQVPSLKNLTELTSIDLSDNSFEGTFPELGELPLMESIILSNNQLSGTIDPSVGLLRFLVEFRVNGNGFSGQVPSFRSDPYYFDISNNLFTGSVSWLQPFVSLRMLDISHNQFVGTVPDLSFRQRLTILSLNHNHFNGSAPDLTGSNNLEFVDFSDNQFEGALPHINSPLQYANFSGNRFTDAQVVTVSNNTRCDFRGNKLLCPVSWDAFRYCNLTCGVGDESSQTIRMRMKGELETFDKEKFLAAISSVANVTKSRLTILELSYGSVIVDMSVGPPPPGSVNEGSAQRAVDRIRSIFIQSPASFSSLGFEVLNVSSIPIAVLAPTNDGLSTLSIIGIAVGVSVGVILLVVIFAVVVIRKKVFTRTVTNQLVMIDVSNIKIGEAKKSIVDYDELEDMQHIGSGAYGIVYKARWRDIPVAVKQIRAEHVNETQLRDFLSEVAILQGLRSHPNVVLFLGLTFPPQPLSLITEYCEMGGLYDYLRKNQVPLEQKMKFIRGVAQGMLHLHLEKVIHRDLAARNILLTSHLEPKVSDFGLSREQSTSTEVSQTTSVVGPLRWMSPEAIQNLTYSTKSDVWSFGVVIWEILVGEEPFVGMSAMEVAIGVTTKGLRLSIPDDTEPVLQKLMDECWNTDPSFRPSFKAICDYLGVQTEAVSTPSTSPSNSAVQIPIETIVETNYTAVPSYVA